MPSIQSVWEENSEFKQVIAQNKSSELWSWLTNKVILRNMTYLRKTKTRHFTTFTGYIFSKIPRKLGRLEALEIPPLLLFKPRSTAWCRLSVSLFCVCFRCCYCCVFVFSFFFKVQFLRKLHYPNLLFCIRRKII